VLARPFPGTVAGMALAIVADSTGYLPQGLAPANLTVVPLTVVVDGVESREGVDISPAEVADALRRRATVSTSRVTPAAFLAVYEQLSREGATEIVSVHLSGDLSGTYDAAVLAARDAPVPVHVVDSRTIGLAMGVCVLRACTMANQGATGAEVAAEVERCAGSSRTWLVVDSLDQLRRGGRIGSAQALLGNALMVKPILQVVDGHVAPFEKQRTARKAVERMAEITVDAVADSPADVAVQHVAAPDRAAELAATLGRALPDCEITVVEVGAVISAHVGLGTISVAVVPK
jgi:DegV family protein with EDD domain